MSATPTRLSIRAFGLASTLALAACAGGPVAPAWELDARGALERYPQLALSGDAGDIAWCHRRIVDYDACRLGARLQGLRRGVVERAQRIDARGREACVGLALAPLLALLHGDGGLGNWQGAGAVSAERIEEVEGHYADACAQFRG